MPGLVYKHRIRADFDEDFVKRDGVNLEVLLKQVVELFMIFVGCKDEGQICRWSSMAKFAINVVAT